jgi:hypothetical protein
VESKGGPVELELVVHTAHLIVGCSSTGQTIADKHMHAAAQLRRHCGPPLDSSTCCLLCGRSMGQLIEMVDVM